ncbi:uroporphyrinogen-III synthase [Oceaniovalibus guishaninsula]|nr:uroporphyrinogen-III synthase [Oceaniovalibus guishaninsula]
MTRTPSLLLTRPFAASRRTAHDLRRAGLTVPILFSPALRIVPLAGDIPARGTLIFTSEAGVAAAAARADLRGRRAVAVGDWTAAAARSAGMTCLSASGDATALSALLLSLPREPEPFVRIRGRHAAGDLAGQLKRAGIAVIETTLYDQRPCPPTDAARRAADTGRTVLPLYSPRSAAIVGSWWPHGAHDLHVVAMSDAVAVAWGATVAAVAPHPDAAAMNDAILAVAGALDLR